MRATLDATHERPTCRINRQILPIFQLITIHSSIFANQIFNEVHYPAPGDTSFENLADLVAGYLAAVACVYLNTPLPWMIGPLLITAGLSISP